MPTEEPISQNEGPEQNTYPGIDPTKSEIANNANKAYSVYKTPERVRNLKKNIKGAKKLGGKAAKMGKAAVRTAQKARQAYAAAQAMYVAGAAIVATSEIWVPILIIFAIIVLFILVFFGGSSSSSSSTQITSSGPVFAKIGDKLNYTIAINYPSAAKNIIITDKIPAGTEYVSAPNASYDPTTNTVTWNLAAITNSTPGFPSADINTTLSLTLLATKDNNYIINTLKGTILGGVLGQSDSLPAKDRPMSRARIVQKGEWQDLAGQLSTFTVTPTLFQTIPNTTPTIFQLAPTNIPVPPRDTNVIKSCVVTKVGDPAVIPSLPPECTSF